MLNYCLAVFAVQIDLSLINVEVLAMPPLLIKLKLDKPAILKKSLLFEFIVVVYKY